MFGKLAPSQSYFCYYCENYSSLSSKSGLLRWFSGKEITWKEGDSSSILGLGRSWRRKWQTTPVFLCERSYGQRYTGSQNSQMWLSNWTTATKALRTCSDWDQSTYHIPLVIWVTGNVCDCRFQELYLSHFAVRETSSFLQLVENMGECGGWGGCSPKLTQWKALTWVTWGVGTELTQEGSHCLICYVEVKVTRLLTLEKIKAVNFTSCLRMKYIENVCGWNTSKISLRFEGGIYLNFAPISLYIIQLFDVSHSVPSCYFFLTTN